MRLFPDVKGKGTYATPDRAEKKFLDHTKDRAHEFNYVIVSTAGGRFAPCVILKPDQQWMAGGFAHNGICVTF